ncbi:protoheme IX farnesyltransferase [Herbihabitans rhizosphaerae]|uniref:Protoheme IX farnesyltransferase n=1 Tax=Herbihabitans rhizosphaerae TaxID=1872711 RepID=A0A4Q7KC27_9PSEU|nr:heme o synthase [Herbihabitans rhizosphaerae]RZS29775.1 protoheme IX farnesyltransferase [Herbihabitans rhizosphaerae]
MSLTIEAPSAPRRPAAVVRSYFALTKPRVIELLLVTTIPAMLLAARGFPPLWQIACTLAGGTLAAGSANALNCYVDADIDKLMKRTKARPLARHDVSPRNALIFGVVLGIAAFAFLWMTVGLLPAIFAVATILFYIFVYTLILKRRTAQNIVWGGAAGCMPVVIGWSAITGGVAWPAFVLFGIVFFWTPPHTWALAIKFKDDYARAGVPMLPVVATLEQVVKQMVIYTWLTVVCSLLLFPVTSWIYPAVAGLAGLWFAIAAHRLRAKIKRGENANTMRFFHLSNSYLSVVFFGLAVDAVVALPVLGWPF